MIEILIPPSLRQCTHGRERFTLEAATVRHAVTSLCRECPDLCRHLLRADGSVRSYVNLYVNEQDIRTLRSLDTEVADGDVVTLVPSIAGGR